MKGLEKEIEDVDFLQEEEEERKLIFRRFVGAGVVLLFTVLLWQFGNIFPSQDDNEDSVSLQTTFDNRDFSNEESKEEDNQLKETERESLSLNVLDNEELLLEEEIISNEEVTDETTAAISVDLDLIKPVSVSVENVNILSNDENEADNPAPKEDKVITTNLGDSNKNKDKNKQKIQEEEKKSPLQVGAFRNKNNVINFVKTLRGADFSSEMIQENDLYRVYIYGLSTQKEQQEAKEKIKKLLSSPSKAKKKTSSVTKRENSASKKTSGGGIVVQIGAFRQENRAKEIVYKLNNSGFTVITERIQRNGFNLSRVRVVGFKNRIQAEEAKIKLIKLGYEGSVVIDTQ